MKNKILEQFVIGLSLLTITILFVLLVWEN